MTKDEAIKILQGAIKKPNTKDGYLGQAINIAIKALEQEPILDKIRTEIEKIPIAPFATAYTAKHEALRIIDKYKAESEVEDGNDD